jgi:hypothetical protein
VNRRSPPSPLEAHDPGKIGIALQQWGESGINPPVNLTFGEMPLEQSQYRQRLNHVAERTGLEDEDFQNAE